MAARLILSELWSTFAANGGTRLTEVRWLTLKTVNRTSGDDTLTGLISYEETAAALVADLTVIRLEREDGTVEEWLIGEYRRGTDGLWVEVTAYPARTFLSGIGSVASNRYFSASTSFTDTLPAIKWWLYYLQNAATGSTMPSWISYGTWDDETTTITLTASDTTYLQFLLNIAAAMGQVNGKTYTVRLRRVDDSSSEIDILENLSSATVNLQYPHNVSRVREITRRVAKPTILIPRGDSDTHISDGYWDVTAKATATLTLAGWSGVGTPIGFDDQFNGYYAKAHDGTFVQITDCTAPATMVMASGTAFTVGDRIQFPFDASGNPVGLLKDPARSVDWIGTKSYGTDSRTNFLRNGDLATWTGGGTTLSNWTVTKAGVGVSYAENTNTLGYDYGGASLSWTFDGVTGPQPYIQITQTFAMPYALRNKVWLAMAKVQCVTTAPNAMNYQLTITSTSGTSSAVGTFYNATVNDWTVLTHSIDETASGTGAWTGGVTLKLYQAAVAPAHAGLIDVCLFCLDSTDTVVLGSGPARLTVIGNADLTANQTPARYEAEVIDRARNDYATFAHEQLILGASGRLVVPSSEHGAFNLDTAFTIVEIVRDELHPLSTTVQLAETAGLLSDA